MIWPYSVRIYWRFIMKNDTGKHYRFTFRGIKLDPARICDIYKVTNLVQGSIIKKALCAGNRGHKDLLRDIDDIITGAQRWKEMVEEDARILQGIEEPEND
jgi:hypothetical protein